MPYYLSKIPQILNSKACLCKTSEGSDRGNVTYFLKTSNKIIIISNSEGYLYVQETLHKTTLFTLHSNRLKWGS